MIAFKLELFLLNIMTETVDNEIFDNTFHYGSEDIIWKMLEERRNTVS